MKSTFIFASAIVLFTTGVFGAGGTLPGTGTASDPYLIENINDFHEFTSNPNYWDDYTRLDCDLDLSAAGTYTQAPIAGDTTTDTETDTPFDGTAFSGTFDGNGHIIRNLTVDGISYCGLFGLLAAGGEVKDIGMEDVSITGLGSCVGGVVGYNYYGSITGCYSKGDINGGGVVGGLAGLNEFGSITNSYSIGTVTGYYFYVGGLVGVSDGSSIANSYSIAAVSGIECIGGLVGVNFSANISNSYARGTVSSNGIAGGLVGVNDNGSIANTYSTGAVTGDYDVNGLVGLPLGNITNSFWDVDSSDIGRPDSYNNAARGKTTREMKDIDTFLNAGWDITRVEGSPVDWFIRPIVDYPRLCMEFLSGSGTAGDPWVIENFRDFQTFCGDPIYWNDYTRLDVDLDLSAAGIYTQAPIAGNTDSDYHFDGTVFSGSFDGNGYVIRNLTINGTYYCGLFGKLGSGSEIKDIGIEDFSITGSGSYVGGVVAHNDHGNITNSYSIGTISGSVSFIGGLVGINEGSIENCYSKGTVSGNGRAGGLVGHNDNGNIANSYSTGTISGSQYAGGLVGDNEGSVTRSYSTGAVTAEKYVGGLVGDNHDSIENCYSTGTVIGTDDLFGNAGGIAGHNYGSITNSYSTGVVTGNRNTGGFVGSNSLGGIASSYFYMYSGPDTGCGQALDDGQLQEKDSFAGFDFVGDASDGTDDHWVIEAGYMPRLSWQDGPGFEAPYILDTITTTLSGTGSANDPFIIASYADMIEFRINSSLRIGNYSLTNDIDLADATYPEAFIPEVFKGIFSGNGHTISNLTIEGGDYLGLFSNIVPGCEIKDLGMVNVSISGGNESQYLGGICAYNYGGNIINCYSTGSVTGENYLGGLCGENYIGKITNCHSTGSVGGKTNVGGLCGSSIGIVNNCYSNCSVTGVDDSRLLGGLCGGIHNSSLNDCYATGFVVAGEHSQQIGGLCGKSSFSSINACYATGSVTGGFTAGGLCGWNYKGSLNNCYAKGSVTGIGGIGGLCGSVSEGEINICYATGKVSGDSNVGGFLGSDNYSHGTFTSSFWNNSINPLISGIGDRTDPLSVMGKTTAEMQTQSTFSDAPANWDFASTWWINDERDYPKLYFQPFGDLDNDSHVDQFDLAVMSAAWGTSEGDANYNSVCELSGDTTIGIADMAWLGAQWLEGMSP